MKSYLTKTFAIILFTGIVSCSKDDLRQNDLKQQKDAVESLNDPYLLSSIIKQTTLFYQDRGWGSTKLPGAVQFTMRNFQGGDNYYSGFKSLDDGMYGAMNILKLVDASIKLADARGSQTHVGIFTTFRVLLFSFMTDFYGDVYYSEALKGREGILYPVYDKQSDIYTGLLKELDDASALISSGTETVSPTYDLMFSGDKTQWLKFCNSLKLRLLMRASVKMSDAGSKIAAVAALPIFSDDADKDASIAYVGTTSVNSWVGGSNNWGSGGEFERRRPCKSLVDRMTTLNDPRMKVWFAPIEFPWTYDAEKNGVTFETTDPNGFTYSSTWEYVDLTNPVMAAQVPNILDVDKVYAGFIAGMNGDFKNGNGHWNTSAGGTYGNFKVSMYSKLFQKNAHALLRAQIMNKDEVQFILAEAAAKGLISGNADTYYRTGIKFSMARWGVSDEDISAYLAQSVIALPGDAAGKLAKIAEQKWIALFSVATEAYLDLRRTKLPDIFKNGLLSTYTFPLRFRYPGNELGQNKNAYDKGVATLTPAVDDEFSKMWLLQ
ncbi:MAG: SusD/RagB family nutrient-binding outer membrane lipoprotein [Porphyromonadaceae bacterium]|nr:MAG: SusD/RagB family nutrient-binding outer membrane lipoprotein [Porphyromonadaceae bacterium]